MKKLILFLLFLATHSVWAQNSSVLSEGTWLKLAISESGVYKLDRSFFEKNAPAFANTDPSKIKIFVGHSAVLPQLNSAPRIQDLKEIPVYLNAETTNWGNQNYIAFYGRGPHSIKYDNQVFSQQINPYSNYNYYFVTISDSPSLRLENNDILADNTAKKTLPYFDYEEKELKNILNSGQLWLGDFFNRSYSFSPTVEDFSDNFTLQYEIFPLGISRQFLKTSSENNILSTDTLRGAPYNANDNNARYGRVSNAHKFTLNANQPYPKIDLSLSSESIGNVGVYLNYWHVNYARNIKYNPSKQIIFRTTPETPESNYLVENNQKNTRIWQIKNDFKIVNIPVNTQNIFALSKGQSDVILFNHENLPYPDFTGLLKNQNLKAGLTPEVMVVYPEKFKTEAERLIQYKRENEDFEIAGVTVENIYNEFSSGKVDPTAIRDFCRFLDWKTPTKLKFLLLLGDASYDFKNNNKTTFANTELLIPTYQSRESLEPIYSFASDDYFGFLEDAQGEWPEGYSSNNNWVRTSDKTHTLKLAVGRIPAKNTSELSDYIDKYIDYKKNIATASWQNQIALLADNRDYNLHQRDAENLEETLLKHYNGFITDKLYLDDFPAQNSNGTYTVPLANQKLHSLVNSGTFLISYIGHGAEDGLTNEKLLTLGDIVAFNNSGKLPIWLTATCQFGKFDNPALVSGAELALLRARGGAIALLTTTRPVYASSNQLVNQAFAKNLSNVSTLGELFQVTKNESISGEINRNFSLLGDPSLTLPFWQKEVDILFSADTLKALSPVSFSGNSPNIENGKLYLKIIDKPSTKKTLGNFSDGPVFEYNLNSEVIFSGTFEISNHTFSGEIILPKEQVSDSGSGKAVLTFIDNQNQYSETRVKEKVLLSSEDTKNYSDLIPPVLEAFIDENQNLIWLVTDQSGINLSSHQNNVLEFKINNEKVNYPLHYYFPIKGANEGQFIYPLSANLTGNVSTSLKISDVYNNSTEKSVNFNIKKTDIKILQSSVFPNPVTDQVNIKVEHNQEGQHLISTFSIVDATGKVIKEMENECLSCPKTLQLKHDLSQFSVGFPKLYYRFSLRSITQNSTSTASGSLFFWK